MARGRCWEARLQRRQRGPWLQFWTTRGFEHNQLTYAREDLSPALDGVRLLYISDVHMRGRWQEAMDDLVERTEERVPDLILYGGDLAHSMHHLGPALPHIQRLVTSLRPRVGAFAVLGNHDGDLLAPRLSEWGVRVLHNEGFDVEVNGATIEVIGMAGPERRDVDRDFIAALPAKRPAVARIVLSHYPDLIRHAAPARPDLFLAGHTHGGQICLPGGFPILRHDSLPRRYCRGVHEFEDVCLVVSRGVGFSSPLQLRLWCPGEIIEVEMKSKAPSPPPSPRLPGEGVKS